MPTREPTVLAADALTLRLVAPASVVWPGVSAPIGPSAAVLSKTLYARPLPCSQLPTSPDLVSSSYALRLDDAGDAQFTFPNVANSEGRLWRDLFDPSGHLAFVEIWLGGTVEQVVCIDTSQVSDGRGFSSTLDATDFCSSLQGNGAGFQSGSTGQLQALVYDPATLLASLFDAQGWQDSSDAAFVSLLQALLNAQLGLRLSPWQLLSTDPASGGGGGQVVVHGQDGMFLLKKAYERDWIVVQSPRDVIERATQLWIAAITDGFPVGSTPTAPASSGNLVTPYGTWSINSVGGATAVVANNGGVALAAPAVAGAAVAINQLATCSATSVWRASCTVQTGVGASSSNAFNFAVTEFTGDEYQLVFWSGVAQFTYPGPGGVITKTLPAAPNYALMLESDGEWVWGFVNGQLVGCVRRAHTVTSSLRVACNVSASPSSAGAATITSVLSEALQPFLQRGADKGDYVLPGVASTYPSGGLQARYYNDADLQSDSGRLSKILAPPRSQAFGGSGTPEYANQQDAQINSQVNPTPGAATSNWSAKWFGAIYLKLSAGNYTISAVQYTSGHPTAMRVWIGKTKFGDQIIDNWTFTNPGTTSVTLSATSLAGTLPYGGGTANRDGWYPIVVEFAVDSAATNGPQLEFTPPSSYTDPGGTALTGGASVVVPATSLSPLGCVDQRYQGVSHFDLAQQTIQGFGYQASVEPQQLESGLFPGVLAPRVREGHDTDLILEPDRTAREDWTGTLRPQLANTWPLPGKIAQMRWRPGDGIRVQNEEIGVRDTKPRPMLVFTRNLLPDGIASAVASLANRPKNAARTLKQRDYSATRQQRNYQRQLTTLTGIYVEGSIAAGADGAGSQIQLSPGDQIKRAQLRIAQNDGHVSFGVKVNGTDVTSSLSSPGPWTTVPMLLDIGAVASAAVNQNINAAVHNNSGTTASTFQYQLLVEVLR